jgi:hypothetical protein
VNGIGANCGRASRRWIVKVHNIFAALAKLCRGAGGTGKSACATESSRGSTGLRKGIQ